MESSTSIASITRPLNSKKAQKLFDLGVPFYRATIYRTPCPARVAGFIDEYVFNSQDLMTLLPLYIIQDGWEYSLVITNEKSQWKVSYYSWELETYLSDIYEDTDLAEALYGLVVWCFDDEIKLNYAEY